MRDHITVSLTARARARMGRRPRASEASTGVTVRLSPDELARLDQEAQAAGVDRSTLVRRRLAADPPQSDKTPLGVEEER